MKWSREDYTGSAVETAKHLIGAVLVHETKEGITAGRITECEAYGGFYRENRMTALILTRGLLQGHKLFLEKAGIFMYI